jgi:hypothetical protein
MQGTARSPTGAQLVDAGCNREPIDRLDAQILVFIEQTKQRAPERQAPVDAHHPFADLGMFSGQSPKANLSANVTPFATVGRCGSRAFQIAFWSTHRIGPRGQDHNVRCATLPALMNSRKTTTVATSDLDPATLAKLRVLKRQRQRQNRTLLKRRRQKSGQ